MLSLGNSRSATGTLCLALLTTILPAVAAAQAGPSASAPSRPAGTASRGTSASSRAGGTGNSAPAALPEVVVTAERLNLARSGIETQTGASLFTFNAPAISALPGGANVQFNQVLLQAPDVVQDSFGQIHVRGDHNDLQYRLNGIILPEGISVFSQALDPRIVSSMNLVTGALPAEYGLRTAGIIDITTKAGVLQRGGTVSLYGGSHQTLEPSGWYGGSSGNFSYFLSADLLRNDLGIESPDASSAPLHDHSTQLHGLGYFEDILGRDDRLSLILGTSDEQFQIPDVHGQEPSLGLSVFDDPYPGSGCSTPLGCYPSSRLNENQHEVTQFAIFSWQHSAGSLNWQSSLSARYTSLDFEPDWVGDLLYNGIAQNAFKQDTALAWQTDASERLNASHTLRAGFYLQHDHAASVTTSQVLPVDLAGNPTSDVPETVTDSGAQTQSIESVYLQDEWQALASLTINYGLRFDAYSAYSSGSQLSPRLNVVWMPLPGTTVHGGYSRYFTPPPFELIGAETFTRFTGTTALPPGSATRDTAPFAERSNYYDVGVEQKLLQNALTLGIDSFYQQAGNLLDEGQFGAPIILTPFNYRFGRIAGLELTGNYQRQSFSAYANLAFQSARGKQVDSAQFNFDPAAFAYISHHYINLDHAQRVSASGGVSYRWLATRFSLDMIFGTGLRSDLQLPNGAVIPNGDHTPSYVQWNFGATHTFHDALGTLTARLDVVNLFDKVYQIRSGSGVGVFESQYGPRRGLFVGLAQDF
jgi:outer membrane receptor protein involved in Fe transport